jgi:hypothetical protein
MLKRYLPGERRLCQPELACGWTAQRYDAAKALILKIREAHDLELTSRRPHSELIVETSAHVRANELAQSLEQGWTLARDAQPFAVPATPLTPVTRLALPLRLVIPPREDPVAADAVWPDERHAAPFRPAKRRGRVPLITAAMGIAAIGILLFVADSGAFLDTAAQIVIDTRRALSAAVNRVIDPEAATVAASPEPGADQKTATLPAGTPIPDATATPETLATSEVPATDATTASETSSTTPHDARVAAPESSESSPSLDAPQSLASSPVSEPAQPADASRASAAAEAVAPPSSTPAENSARPPSSSSPRVSGTRSRQTEGYRSKLASPSSRVAQSASPPTVARTPPLRPAEAARRTQLPAPTRRRRLQRPRRAPSRHAPRRSSQRSERARPRSSRRERRQARCRLRSRPLQLRRVRPPSRRP